MAHRITVEVLECGNVRLNGVFQVTNAQVRARGGTELTASIPKLRKRLRTAGIEPPRGLKIGDTFEASIEGPVAVATWEERTIGDVCVDLVTDDGEPLREPWSRVDPLDGKTYTRRDAYVVESPLGWSDLIPL